jgi:hypothetical protein
VVRWRSNRSLIFDWDSSSIADRGAFLAACWINHGN